MGKEKNFERRIKTWIKENGGWCVKYHGDAFSTAGTPDLLSCMKGRFVAIEVKADDGKPSELQVWTVRQIRKSGGIAVILFPAGWETFRKWAESGFIEEMPEIVNF